MRPATEGSGRLAGFQHPRVGAEVVQRTDHGFADAQRLPPAERLEFRGVEEDERAVADPPARAAGVPALRAQPQALADPAERVIDLTVLVGAEVDDVHRLSGLRNDGEDRVYAVLNVEVALA